MAGAFPVQWKQLIKRFVTKVVEEHQVQFQLGIRTVLEDLEPLQEEPLVCPVCHRVFGRRKHWKCIAGVPTAAGVRPVFLFWALFCPVCQADFVTRPRAIAHLMRGALGCVLQWRLGALPACPIELVQAAGEADNLARREARSRGGAPGIGIPYMPP